MAKVENNDYFGLRQTWASLKNVKNVSLNAK